MQKTQIPTSMKVVVRNRFGYQDIMLSINATSKDDALQQAAAAGYEVYVKSLVRKYWHRKTTKVKVKWNSARKCYLVKLLVEITP
jgi:hypothetical protein